MKKLSIYIHIPFCHNKKCNYCDFVSFCDIDNKQEIYVKTLLKEIKMRAKTLKNECEIATIFIGGGTPSVLLGSQIGDILKTLKKHFRVCEDAEITVEANPDSLTEQKLRDYLMFGVNRLSIGGQTMNDKILKIIGRQHTSKQLKNAILLAKKVGFLNLNVDMMIGLPKQRICDARKMLNFLIKHKVPHISCYSLILEENTPLWKSVKEKKIFLPKEEKILQMYDFVYKKLKSKNYFRYEVSNFAKENFECEHNKNYWEMGEYLAFGVAGHSFLNGERFENTSNFEDYVKKIQKGEFAVIKCEKISLLEQKEESIMLSLRTNKGINLVDFNKKFSCDLLKDKEKEIAFLSSHKFIDIENGTLKVSENAFYISNSIIAKLV
ncbi:MAG: radical SAM family heme chaperone HemW [Clostridia bacterium]|nr:radical SAM family heme chaperone HemW [Clostridia bacterium]